jgi:hypothetical protein
MTRLPTRSTPAERTPAPPPTFPAWPQLLARSDQPDEPLCPAVGDTAATRPPTTVSHSRASCSSLSVTMASRRPPRRVTALSGRANDRDRGN